MKLKSGFIAAAMLLFATASFAKSSTKANTVALKNFGKKAINSCTVTVKSGKTSATITFSCDCTTGQACDKAYALAKVFVA